MSFIKIPDSRRMVKGEGPPSATIAIVGEASSGYEDKALRPFIGPPGTILEQCLHTAGLIRGEVYLTNLIKERPPGGHITPYFNGKTFSAEGFKWVEILREELDELKPNIIVACGKTALAALTDETNITGLRGSTPSS